MMVVRSGVVPAGRSGYVPGRTCVSDCILAGNLPRMGVDEA